MAIRSLVVTAALSVVAIIFHCEAMSAEASSGRQTVKEQVFNGSSLAGWHTLGGAEWRVDNGTIVGTVRNGADGWLILDEVYGNATVTLKFECNQCETGLLVRSGKAANQTSGVYVPLSGAAIGRMSRVTLDANGKESSRTPLPENAGMYKIVESPDFLTSGGCAPVPCAGIRDAHGGGIGSAGSLVIPAPPVLKAGVNELTVSMGDVFAGNLNGTRLQGYRMDGGHAYGQIALHVAGAKGATLRIAGIEIQDHTTRISALAPEVTEPKFERVQLTDIFYAEGIAMGDINRDGKQDIISGPLYYLGPDFRVAHEIYPPAAIAVAGAEYPGGPAVPQAGSITHGNYPPSFMSWVRDFNGDGWPDVFMVMAFGPRPTFSGHVFLNPQGQKRHWDNHQVIPLITTEANQFVDVNGDGRPELTMQVATRSDWSDAQVGYAEPDWSDATKPWKFTAVSDRGRWSGHGLGTGDVNNDGRMDLVSPAGWWEQPATSASAGNWKYHATRFGNGGAEIAVYDVNGDGSNDIVTSLAAHGPGLAWFEQRKDGSFEQHTIMRAPEEVTSRDEVAFTELHALTMADVDGDGLKDIVTGKRWYSHGYRYDEEDDFDDPPVLYWFKLTRGAGGQVSYQPHLINNRSGVGVQVVAGDVNGDGKLDILTSARKGSFVFYNRTR